MSESSTITPAIIIDIGSYQTVLGIAGQHQHEAVEPTISANTADPILSGTKMGGLSEMARETLYGTSALKFKSVLNVSYFLKHYDYLSFSRLIQQVLESKYIDPTDYSLVLIVPSILPNIKRLQLADALFTQLKFPRITFIPTSVCALTALNLNTGIVIDVGFLSTKIESIFKGFPNDQALFEYPIGGFHITQYISAALFSQLQYRSAAPLEWIAENIKQSEVFCDPDPIDKKRKIMKGDQSYDRVFKLPDASTIKLNRELFECAEVIFVPELAHIQTESLIELIVKSIRAWDRAQVPELLKNIVICGNGSRIPGLKEKILSQIKDKFSKLPDVNLVSVSDPKVIFWRGASQLFTKKLGKFDWIENPNTDGDSNVEEA